MPGRVRAVRTALVILAVTCSWVWYISPTLEVLLHGQLREVEDAFDHAWSGYVTHCWGDDSIHPVSNTCDNDLGGWAATAIDALPTAIIMRKEDVVLDILALVQSINFKELRQGERFQLFEVAIRHFGGLLSAWDLLNGPFKYMARDPALRKALYEQMIALGDVLSCAFDTPTGIPRNWVDPKQCESDQSTSNSIAGAGTLILEFARLSDITDDPKYERLARKAEEFVLDPHPVDRVPYPGILGSSLSVNDGQLLSNKGSWGSLSDSFYEYLLKAYVYDQERYSRFFERWKITADSTILYIANHPHGHPEWTFLPYWEGQQRTNAMDALSWFAGGNFLLAGMVSHNQTLIDFGLSIADTGGAMYNRTATGLGGEFIWWTENCSDDWSEKPCTAENSYKLTTLEFNLRPEVVETWYYAYRATGDRKYRDWAWSTFQAMQKYCKTDSGYSAISDVTADDGGDKLDRQESFLFAEMFLYIYLILTDERKEFQVHDSRRGGRNTWVFNTEAHPIRVAGRPL